MKDMDGESGVVEAEGSYTCLLNLMPHNTRFGHKVYAHVILVFCSARGQSVSFINTIYSYGMSGRSMMWTGNLPQVLRFRVSGAVPVIPLYACVAFKQTALRFTFTRIL
jgi:hypothetical protein